MKKFLCCVLAVTLLAVLPTNVMGSMPYVGYVDELEIPDPLPPDPDSGNIRIGVTDAAHDNVGQILRYFGTGVDFYRLSAAAFNDTQILNSFYAIFINCGSQDVVNSRNLTQFVYQGGVVYASDHASRPVIAAFPGVFSFSTVDREVTVRNAEIVHSTLAAHMGMTNLDVVFNMSSWHAVSTLDENATVYIRGNVPGRGTIPLAFSFNYGRGTVFYTSFHNNAQATMEMIDFIEYLVFRIKLIEVDREMAERAAREGFHYRGQMFGILSEEGDYESFLYTFDDDEFMLMFDGDFDITLTDPLGNEFRVRQRGDSISFEPTAPGAAAPPTEMAFEAMEGGGVRVQGGEQGEWGIAVAAAPSPAAPGDAALEPAIFALGIATGGQGTNQQPGDNLPFTDIAAHSSRDAILFVYESSIMQGTGGNLFSPNLHITRGMVATILQRFVGEPTYVSNPFSDVAAGAWYNAGVAWASEAGIVLGFEDGSFRPGEFVTYEQLAVMLLRFTEYLGIYADASIVRETAAFYGQPSEWALHSVIWASQNSLFEGLPADTMFVPRGNVTRADIATVIYNFALKLM